MDEIAGINPVWWLFASANIAIACGYIYAATKVAPLLPVRTKTRMAGFLFFFFCAGTHMEMNFHGVQYAFYRENQTDFHMLFIHICQAFAIWCFVIWWFKDLENLRLERHTTEAPRNSRHV